MPAPICILFRNTNDNGEQLSMRNSQNDTKSARKDKKRTMKPRAKSLNSSVSSNPVSWDDLDNVLHTRMHSFVADLNSSITERQELELRKSSVAEK